MYNKSRGATIFTDKEGSIRIPSDVILEMMEFRDLEELYHRYTPNIRIYCFLFLCQLLAKVCARSTG